MKIVINRCYGGFSVSDEVCKEMGLDYPHQAEEYRTDPKLIELVETLGEKANGSYARLQVVEIPDEATDYYIEDYDGVNTIIYVLDGKLHFA